MMCTGRGARGSLHISPRPALMSNLRAHDDDHNMNPSSMLSMLTYPTRSPLVTPDMHAPIPPPHP